MKKIFLYFALFCFQTLSATPLQVSVQAEAAILINADTGAILYEKNAHKPYHPASITKIATAVYALSLSGNELGKMVSAPQDCIVSVTEDAKKKAQYNLPSHWLEPGGMHIGIKKGEELSLKDLLYGMMIASGNDAANVIAHHCCGSVPTFMKELNEFIKDLGCENTTFYNPHGLHHPEHVSTAYDMAVITREGFKSPLFRDIVKTVRYQRPKTNRQEATTLLQTNRLLKKGPHFNPDAIGVKTGYISNASHTFVSAAERDGRTLIAVLLKSKEREDIFKDSNKLFEAAFRQPKVKKVYVPKGQQKHRLKLTGGGNLLKTFSKKDVTLEFYPAEEPKVKCLLNWDPSLTVPVAKNQAVAELSLCDLDGKVLSTESLYALEDVKPTVAHRIKQTQFKPLWLLAFTFFAVLLFVLFQKAR